MPCHLSAQLFQLLGIIHGQFHLRNTGAQRFRNVVNHQIFQRVLFFLFPPPFFQKLIKQKRQKQNQPHLPEFFRRTARQCNGAHRQTDTFFSGILPDLSLPLLYIFSAVRKTRILHPVCRINRYFRFIMPPGLFRRTYLETTVFMDQTVLIPVRASDRQTDAERFFAVPVPHHLCLRLVFFSKHSINHPRQLKVIQK